MPLVRRRPLAGLAAVGGVALIAGCGGGSGSLSAEDTTTPATATATAPITSTAPATTGGAGDTQAYVEDVQAAAGALQEFGQVLQSTTSLDDLRGKLPQARQSLDEFDAAIGELTGYTVSDATVERQRAGLAETGPRVSDVLRRFLSAAESGDVTRVQALVPEVTSTIQDFQDAATGGGTGTTP